MKQLFTFLALFGLAVPAAACINDVELPSHEREFRSQYRDTEKPTSAPAIKSVTSPSSPLLFGAGSVLLVGASALALSGRRSRS